MFGPVGGFVEWLRSTIDSDRERAACDDDARHAFRGRRVQQTLVPPMLTSLHLLELCRPAADAHLERQVKDRINTVTCGAQRLRVLEVPLASADIEPVQRIEIAFTQLQHTRTDALLVQPLRDMVAKEAAGAGDQCTFSSFVDVPASSNRREKVVV